MAGDLDHLGLRKVGEVVLDDGYFDGERVGPGYDQEDGDRAYLAPAGALSLDFNTVEIHVSPGEREGWRARVVLSPASPYLIAREPDGDRRPLPGSGVVKVSTRLERGKQRVVVEGRVAQAARPHTLWRRIDDPTLFFGNAFKALLEQRGDQGRARPGRAGARVGAAPPGVSQSDSLAEIVRRLNKTSNNFTAEQLLKTLGAELKGHARHLGQGRRGGRGRSWPRSASRAAATCCATAPASTTPTGSRPGSWSPCCAPCGPASRSSPSTWSRCRWPVATGPSAGAWTGPRPPAGSGPRPGPSTAWSRSPGTCRTRPGQVLAFAILVNDSPGPRRRGAGGGRAGRHAGGDGGRASRGRAGRARLGGAPSDPGPSGSGPSTRSAGPATSRNQPLLRRALRGEADPAVRLALAECVCPGRPGQRLGPPRPARGPGRRPAGPAPALAAPPAGGRSGGPVAGRLGRRRRSGGAPPAASSSAGPAARRRPGWQAAVERRAGRGLGRAPEELLARSARRLPSACRRGRKRTAWPGWRARTRTDHPFPAALRALAAREDELSE